MNKLVVESIDAMAYRYSALAILNCYVREIAIPHQLLDFLADNSGGGTTGILFIEFPSVGRKLSINVANQSLIGNYIYTSDVLASDSGEEAVFEQLAWTCLPALIVEELCLRYQNDNVKAEMLMQIENSTNFIKQSVAYGRRHGQQQEQCSSYIESESALIYGHSFHPAPKCRQGFNDAESLLYGPEFGSSFQLHYFALSPVVLWMANSNEFPMRSLIQEMGQVACSDIPSGWSLLPCHPWQAKYLLQQTMVQKSIENQSLRYLGESGIFFRPTASVRTLYNPDFPYFLKCSLSMRITNSVRKNAYYELDASVRLTKILLPVVAKLEQQFSGFEFVLEPCALSANIPDADEEQQSDLRSHFGVIFRDAAPFQRSGTTQQVLSATLFGDNHLGEPWLEQCINVLSARTNKSQRHGVALDWFALYIKHLVPPLLAVYFDQGVACEPHLQNVVVKLEDGWPCGVIMRDLEGTKLIRGMWQVPMLEGLAGRALASVLHDESKTWQRVSYCLFVNHIAQAIYQLCRIGEREQQLWGMVRESLTGFVAKHNSELVRQRIGGLLEGDPLIAKANLITRFFQHADSNASYVLLPNPLAVPVWEYVEHA